MLKPLVRVSLLILPIVFSACGDDSDEGPPPLEGVRSWHCCAESNEDGDSCECVELTPGRARECSGKVDVCTEGEREYGCCVAFHDGDAWQCECYPAGSDCSTLSGPEGLQEVTRCPP